MKNIKYLFVWLFVFPLIVPILILSFILRFVVCLCIPISRKELAPLKSMDYIVVGLLGKDFYPPRGDNFNIGFTCKFRGNVDSKVFFQNFLKNVINVHDPIATRDDPHIRFHQNIERVCGYWFFKTFETISYSNHVTCISINEKSSKFQEEICTWLKIRYSRDHPMWGMLFLYDETTDQTYYGFKIHHVLAGKAGYRVWSYDQEDRKDGYTLMHILDLMTNTSYNYRVKDFEDSKLTKVSTLTKPYPINNSIKIDVVIFKEAAFNLVQYTRMLYRKPKSYVTDIIRGENKIKSDKLFMAFTSLPLSIVQDIRRMADVNFASVMMCLINDCVKDLLVEYMNKKLIRKIPEYNVISNTLAWPKHPRCIMCNHFTAGMFAFNLRQNRTKKLKSVDEEFKGFHKKHLNKIVRGFWESLATFPDSVMRSRLVHNGIIDRVTTSYVHLTGSHNYDSVMGISCEDVRMFCLLPSKINQIVVTCLTTSDEVRVIVGGNNLIFPTQEDSNLFFQKSFQKNLEELSAEWLGK